MRSVAGRAPSEFTVWDPVDLNKFGLAATRDLENAGDILEKFSESLEHLRMFRRALRVQDRHPSLMHQLGSIDESFLGNATPTHDGVQDIRIVSRSIVPETLITNRSPFTIHTSPVIEMVSEMGVVRSDRVHWANQLVTRMDASTYTRDLSGPVVTYWLSLDAPIECNYLSFVSLVPARLVNVFLHGNGAKTSVAYDSEIFGEETIHFDPQMVDRVEVVINQPGRVFDEDYVHIFGMTEWDVGGAMYNPNWTWDSGRIEFPDEIYSVDIHAVERWMDVADTLPNAMHYSVNGDSILPKDSRVFEHGASPDTDDRLHVAIPAGDSAFLHLPSPVKVLQLYRDGSSIGSGFSQTGPQKLTLTNQNPSSVSEYVAHATSEGFEHSYRLFHVDNPLNVKVEFKSLYGDYSRPPVLDELWLRVKFKRS